MNKGAHIVRIQLDDFSERKHIYLTSTQIKKQNSGILPRYCIVGIGSKVYEAKLISMHVSRISLGMSMVVQ